MIASAAAMVLLSGWLHAGAPAKFPHSGDTCKDACAMTKMGCEDDCTKRAKAKDPSAKTCAKDCRDEVKSCEQNCPAMLQDAKVKMKEREANKGKAKKDQTPIIPAPAP